MSNDLSTIIKLGSYPIGAIPLSLNYQFKDYAGDPLDLSTGTWSAQARNEQLHVDSQPADLGSGNATVDALTAIASYDWAPEDFTTVGEFELVLWIGNGTNREASKIFRYEVYAGPGAAPTV